MQRLFWTGSLRIMNVFVIALHINIIHTTVQSQRISFQLEDESGSDNERQPVHMSFKDVQRKDYDPVLRLNRFTLENTILDANAPLVPHWIVMFCNQVWEPCQATDEVFTALGDHWQEKLNTDLLQNEVRFATVDCGTEKALCNSQGVRSYPTVAHYEDHKQTRRWIGNMEKDLPTNKKEFQKFLTRELEELPRIKREKKAQQEASASWKITPEETQRLRFIMFAGLLSAVLGNAWYMYRGSTSCDAKLAKNSVLLGADSNNSPAAKEGGCTVADNHHSRLLRALPKEWREERRTMEL